ncbi:MAG: hypothetical protein V2B15_08555 [Bacteroidota bacterium]
MKRILPIIFLFASISLFSQQKGRFVVNPLTGKMEYVANIYTMPESLIHIGRNNTTYASLNTILGYNNYMNANSLAIGWDNTLSCGSDLALGKLIRCNSDKNMTIGFGAGWSDALETNMPGAIGFGFFSNTATLSVHSGYDMPNNGYVGDIGGVRIGKGRPYNTDSTALEIYALRDNETYVTEPSGFQYIATENDEWFVGLNEMEVAGTMTVGYMECQYVPRIYSGAADTSLLPTPSKIGDYYIDTSARDVYISTGTDRGTWKKVN